jgi:hypothetical protein
MREMGLSNSRSEKNEENYIHHLRKEALIFIQDLVGWY